MELDYSKDRYEDYDIRINKNYTSLLVSDFGTPGSTEDHKKALPIKRVKVLPTIEYLNKYSKIISHTSTILPPGCRYIENLSNGSKIFVIEEQPQFRTVSMNISFDMMYEEIRANGQIEEYKIKGWLKNPFRNGAGDKYYQLNLAFPYVIFIICVNENSQVKMGYSFLRTKQMLGLSDYLLKIPMTNINSDQRICFGDRLNKNQYPTDAAAVRDTIDIFWTSIFNQDYIYNLRVYDKVPSISNYLEWQYLSQTNPMFIYQTEWIKYKRNIFELIKNIKGNIVNNRESGTDIGLNEYKTFISTFTKAVRIGEITTGKIRKRTEPIFYDIANGYYLDDLLRIEVGDLFKNEAGTKEYHVISFLGAKGKQPTSIRLSYDGGLFNFKFTELSIKYLQKRIEAERYCQSIIIGDLEIHSGDIIKYENKSGVTLYQKVLYIRKSLDGRPEIRMGRQYYLAQNFPSNIEKIETDGLLLYGMTIEKGKEYLYSRNNSFIIIDKVENCLFDGINVNSNGNLIFDFKATSGDQTWGIKIQDTEDVFHYRRIYPIPNKKLLCQNPLAISVGRLIRKFTEYNSNDNLIPAKIYKTPTHFISNININDESSRRADELKSLITDDRFFKIETHSGMVEFEIGDLVVVANWMNPLSVLDIKRIEGFKITDEGQSSELSFILTNKAGNVSEEVFVTSGVVKIGYIRKIVTQFEQLSSGTKIIAEKGRISNFPKKDVNIIIGIIVDGPNPLVLCSNGCTLWYQDVIENFKQIPISSVVWKTKEYAPLDPKKIKLQAGDITLSQYSNVATDPGYLMVQISGTRALRYHPLSSYMSSFENYSIDNHSDYILNCIPNPRISKPKQDKDGWITATTNFHGGIVANERSQFLYVNDGRSLINV